MNLDYSWRCHSHLPKTWLNGNCLEDWKRPLWPQQIQVRRWFVNTQTLGVTGYRRQRQKRRIIKNSMQKWKPYSTKWWLWNEKWGLKNLINWHIYNYLVLPSAAILLIITQTLPSLLSSGQAWDFSSTSLSSAQSELYLEISMDLLPHPIWSDRTLITDWAVSVTPSLPAWILALAAVWLWIKPQKRLVHLEPYFHK